MLKINFIPSLFLEILQICYIGYFGYAKLWLPKVMVSACRKLCCFSSCKKSNLSVAWFLKLKYCQDIAKLLFLTHLATPTKPNSFNLLGTLMFFYVEKINLVSRFFLETFHVKESYNLIGREHSGP